MHEDSDAVQCMRVFNFAIKQNKTKRKIVVSEDIHEYTVYSALNERKNSEAA